MLKTTLKRVAHLAVLTCSLQASALAFGADDSAASDPAAAKPNSSASLRQDEAAFYPGDVSCEARNLRGASYYGRASGPDAYARACDYAMDQCYRDTLVRGSCHVTWSGPSDQPWPQPAPAPEPYPSRDPRLCDVNWDTSDATACGAPDGNGRQWYCSPRNNWCVLP